MRKHKKTMTALSSATALAIALALGSQAVDAQQLQMQNQATMNGGSRLMLLNATDLTVGSRGQAVIELQGLLAELGYLTMPSGTPMGYFGEMTRSALAGYQRALGVPSTGYFGPMTRTAMAVHFTERGWLDNFTDTADTNDMSADTGSNAATSSDTNVSGTNDGMTGSPTSNPTESGSWRYDSSTGTWTWDDTSDDDDDE